MSIPADTPPADSLRFETHVDVTEPGTAVALLAASSGLSRGRVKRAMTMGAAWLTRGRKTQRIRRATRSLAAGDRLHLYYDERVLSLTLPPPVLVADEGAYSVWNKPFGMRSQGSKWSDHLTVTRYAEQHLVPERTAFVVHRIDRAATGLIVVAHEKRAAATLSAQFANREVEKRYRAIVHGRVEATPGADTHHWPRIIDTPIDGREARSEVRLLEHHPASNRSLLEVRIETGRKHQIRRHLAGIGHPVVGDRLHGDDAAFGTAPSAPRQRGAGGADEGPDEDLKLTAVLIAFRYPAAGPLRRYAISDEELPTLTTTATDEAQRL